MLSPRHLDHLGNALRQMRVAAHLTQAELCERAGVRVPQLSRWENGHDVPTLESLLKLLGSVGAGLAELERLLLAEVAAERQASVAREMRQIHADHGRRIAADAALSRAIDELLGPPPRPAAGRERGAAGTAGGDGDGKLKGGGEGDGGRSDEP